MRFIHGGVGVFDQRFTFVAIFGEKADTDTGAGDEAVGGEFKGFRHCLDYFIGNAECDVFVTNVLQDNGKLITAQAGNGVLLAYATLQTSSDFLQ